MKKSQKQIQKEWYKNNRARCSLNLMDENNEVHLSRLRKILSPAPTGRLLEIGCGSGWYSGRLGRTVALDISFESVRKIKTDSIPVVGDVENLPFKKNSFNFVYGFGILHHLENIEEGLMETGRVLKPDGCIAFGAENSSSCPMNYIFPFIYGNWKIEKGFLRISEKKIKGILKRRGYENFKCGFGGFAVYGMGKIVYKVTKFIESAFLESPFFRKFSGFMYFTARKEQR